jgi:hypothetical protein
MSSILRPLAVVVALSLGLVSSVASAATPQASKTAQVQKNKSNKPAAKASPSKAKSLPKHAQGQTVNKPATHVAKPTKASKAPKTQTKAQHKK